MEFDTVIYLKRYVNLILIHIGLNLILIHIGLIQHNTCLHDAEVKFIKKLHI
jgi:hypothetical protein